MLLLLAVLVILGVAYRATTGEERARLLGGVLAVGHEVKGAEAVNRQKCEPFHNALRERTRWALVTPTLAGLSVAMFVFMVFGAGALGDPNTLVDWGGSLGTRTTNGEWWRLLTSMFVHSGISHLVIEVTVLVQIGFVLERVVGMLAFATVYVASGLFASLVSVSTYPIGVTFGASGAIFGLYGLLLASSFWSVFKQSSVKIPLVVVKRFAPMTIVFILYSMVSDSLGGAAELTGFVVGLTVGLVLAKGTSDRLASTRLVGSAAAATLVSAVASAILLRGITDVKPEIERVVAIEDRTTGAYQTAADRYKNGRIGIEALAQLIDRTIVPELEAADARLKTLHKVPPEHQPLVADAEEYVRLRTESWRLRAEELRRSNLLSLQEARKKQRISDESWRLGAEARYRAYLLTRGNADGTERASLEVLKRIKSGGGEPPEGPSAPSPRAH